MHDFTALHTRPIGIYFHFGSSVLSFSRCPLPPPSSHPHCSEGADTDEKAPIAFTCMNTAHTAVGTAVEVPKLAPLIGVRHEELVTIHLGNAGRGIRKAFLPPLPTLFCQQQTSELTTVGATPSSDASSLFCGLLSAGTSGTPPRASRGSSRAASRLPPRLPCRGSSGAKSASAVRTMERAPLGLGTSGFPSDLRPPHPLPRV